MGPSPCGFAIGFTPKGLILMEITIHLIFPYILLLRTMWDYSTSQHSPSDRTRSAQRPRCHLLPLLGGHRAQQRVRVCPCGSLILSGSDTIYENNFFCILK